MIKKKSPHSLKKLEVAEQWIEKGYPITKVLEILEANRSTYYYHQNGKVEEKAVGGGRPTPGYSLPTTGEKVPDEQIKEWLSELVMGRRNFPIEPKADDPVEKKTSAHHQQEKGLSIV
ncbi:hypothetical protein BV455_01990 [Parageobacillus caldoxylosilyticus]|nr:hypothetical protein BV455_01990 [Parageobacillus caldoxylosilyticus]